MNKKKKKLVGEESKGISLPAHHIRNMASATVKAKHEKRAATKQTAQSKRSLRIVKRVKNAPVLGVCEYCNMQFSADPLGPAEAQAIIQQQFNAHTCKPENASQAAARIVREATRSVAR